MTRADLLALAARVEAALPFEGGDYTTIIKTGNANGRIEVQLRAGDLGRIAAALRAMAEEAGDE